MSAPAPDAAAAGPARPGRGPGQLAGGPGPPQPGHRRHADRGAGLAPPGQPRRPGGRHPGPGAAPPRAPGRAAAGRLDDAVLDRYLPLGPVRRHGSRYCPSCLAERDGRWLLSWRLGWTFACTTHGVLLCDTCPACGQAPRGRAGRAGLNPPGTCPNTIKRHELLRRGPAPGDRRPGSRPATRCWPPSTGPAPCSPSMTPARGERAPRRARRPGHRRLLGAAPGTGGPVRRLRPGGAGRLARMEPAVTCCPPPAGPVPARQRRADRRPGRHRHDRAHRERRAGHRADPGAAAAPGGPAAAPARRAARPALAAAIDSGPRPVPARPGPGPRPRRPDPLPHRHPPGGHPGRPARAARRPRPGDPAAALAGLGDPADARPRVRGRPVPQHHRRVPAAARPPRPRHPHGHHRPARATAAPWPSARCCGPWPAAATTPCSPRSAAWPATSTPAAAPSTTSAAATSSPPKPSPPGQWRDLCYGVAAHPGEAPPAPRRPALPVPAAHRRRPARPPARPRVHHRQRLQPLPGLRRHPPHRAAGRAARPRRRPPARPRHQRAADLGTAARLLRRPDPARTRTGRHRPGRRQPASSSPAGSPSPTPPRSWAPPPATSGSRSNTSPGPPASGAGPPRPRHGSGSSTPAPS